MHGTMNIKFMARLYLDLIANAEGLDKMKEGFHSVLLRLILS